LYYNHALSSKKKSIIIIDRGILDNKAYCNEDMWERLLFELDLSLEELRSRYDIVIHMVSAAIGAEKH